VATGLDRSISYPSRVDPNPQDGCSARLWSLSCPSLEGRPLSKEGERPALTVYPRAPPTHRKAEPPIPGGGSSGGVRLNDVLIVVPRRALHIPQMSDFWVHALPDLGTAKAALQRG
jgi:hypothetical protein